MEEEDWGWRGLTIGYWLDEIRDERSLKKLVRPQLKLRAAQLVSSC